MKDSIDRPTKRKHQSIKNKSLQILCLNLHIDLRGSFPSVLLPKQHDIVTECYSENYAVKKIYKIEEIRLSLPVCRLMIRF